MNSWNQVLNFVTNLKYEFMKNFTLPYVYLVTKESPNCLEYWAEKLNSIGVSYYSEVLSFLKITEFNNFVLLRYKSYAEIALLDLEDNPKSTEELFSRYNGLLLECRSVVIDHVNLKLVLTPFKKFFNLNELSETAEDAIRKRLEKSKYIEISNKLDGSMQQARYYENSIVMSGSLALDAEKSWRLAEGYSYIANPNYVNMLKDNPDYTFIFEFIHPRDAHVVKYDTDRTGLSLIGIRNSITGEELNYSVVLSYAEKYNILTTELFNLTFDEVLNNLDACSSDEAEGFVINIDGFRFKLKYNDYCSVHRILSALASPNLVVESIADDKYDDLLAKVPKVYQDRIISISDVVFEYIRKMNRNIDEWYAKMYDPDIKTFMIAVDTKVPKQYQGYLKCRYTNRKFNLLKPRVNKYLKFSQITKLMESL